MRKRLLALIFPALAILVLANCGKSECRRYRDRFCADPNSAACKAAQEKSKDWSADKCRIERNQMDIEDQSRNLENELK